MRTYGENSRKDPILHGHKWEIEIWFMNLCTAANLGGSQHSQKDKESQSVLQIKQISSFFRTIDKSWCNISLYGMNKFVCQSNEFYFSCVRNKNCMQIFRDFHIFFLSLNFIIIIHRNWVISAM